MWQPRGTRQLKPLRWVTAVEAPTVGTHSPIAYGQALLAARATAMLRGIAKVSAVDTVRHQGPLPRVAVKTVARARK